MELGAADVWAEGLGTGAVEATEGGGRVELTEPAGKRAQYPFSVGVRGPSLFDVCYFPEPGIFDPDLAPKRCQAISEYRIVRKCWFELFHLSDLEDTNVRRKNVLPGPVISSQTP